MASTRFPFKIEKALEVERFAKYYKGIRESQVVVGPKKYLFDKAFEGHAETIYNMPVRPDDTFVVTFPRSGTTLTQELVWLIKNDLDFEKAKSIPLTDRYPFLEHIGSSSGLTPTSKSIAEQTDERKRRVLKYITTTATEVLAETPSPRFIKTHLPISLLPVNTLNTAKVVYVARDPRDVMVSVYHFQLSEVRCQYEGDFEAFFDQFISDCIPWSPFLEHVKEGWELRNHPNMLFLFYEDLIKDMASCLRRVANFFDKQYNDEQFAALADHLHIDNFKKNASVDPQVLRDAGFVKGDFIRKGKSNGWSEYLDEKLQARMGQWMEKGLKGSTLRFPTQ